MRLTPYILINITIIFLLPIMTYFNYQNFIFNLAFSDILLGAMGLICLYNIKKLLQKKNKWAIYYFIALILSLILSHVVCFTNINFITPSNKSIIVEIIKTVVIGLYFLTSLTYNNDPQNYKIALLAISFSAIPVLLIGYLSYFQYLFNQNYTFTNYAIKNYRFIGTFKDPNLCAFYLNMIIFISMLNFKLHKEKFIHYFLIILIASSASSVLLTMSRGGLLGLGIGIIMVLFLSRKNLKKELILYLISCCIILMIFTNMELIVNKGKSLQYFYNRIHYTLAVEISESGRLQLLNAALNMGNDNFVFGVGKGGFQLNSYKYLGLENPNYTKGLLPHNTLASFYAQQGIIGLLVFTSLFIYLFILIHHSKKEFNNYIIALYCCWFVQSMFINIENIRFFWYLNGLILSAELNEIDLKLIESKSINKKTFNRLAVWLSTPTIFLFIYTIKKILITIHF